MFKLYDSMALLAAEGQGSTMRIFVRLLFEVGCNIRLLENPDEIEPFQKRSSGWIFGRTISSAMKRGTTSRNSQNPRITERLCSRPSGYLRLQSSTSD